MTTRYRAGYRLQATGDSQKRCVRVAQRVLYPRASSPRPPAGSARATRFACAPVALLLAGCAGSLLETELPVSTQYVLAAAPAAASGTAATQADLSIGHPDVAPGLATSRIAVLKGQQLDYYRGATWGESVAEVVQALLVGTFEEQRLFRSVTPEQARVAGNYMLDVEVRNFQAEYGAGGAPTVHVRIIGRLVRVSDRKLVETVTAEARNTAADNRMAVVAASFQAAAQQVAVELAQKVATAIAREPVSAPRAQPDP
jgi:cholesterol transport system auxiliary component